MNMEEIVRARHSVRTYTERPLEAAIVDELKRLAADYNKQYSLHIQLVTDEPDAFGKSLMAKLGGLTGYGSFKNVRNYFCMVGPDNEESAINQQKFTFALLPDDKVMAQRGKGPYAQIDLGIVRCHFELGAEPEKVIWA